MKPILLSLLLFFAMVLNAQKETFGLATFTPIKGWKRTATPELVQFMKQDAAKGTYCALSLFRAMNGTADVRENFRSSWKTIVQGLITNIGEPETQEPSSDDGWDAMSGHSPFEAEGSKGIALLVTSSSGGQQVNILILTNTDVYEKDITAFLESVSFSKVAVNTPATSTGPVPAEILGTWVRSASINPEYADPVATTLAGYSTYQYTFNTNGTYTFYVKNFRMSMDDILLIRESGTFEISGTNITVIPKKSVIESWSKKNRSDGFGKMTSTQNRPLERTTYQFTKYYFTGIQEWNLVLLADKPTQRDGPYSNNKTFPNAWYFKSPGPNTSTIDVPGETATPQTKPAGQTAAVAPSGAAKFENMTTRFNNGWTAAQSAEYVTLTKGNAKILLHYGIAFTDEIRKDIPLQCWNTLAADRYTVRKLIRPDFRSPWADEQFIQAEATEKNSGRNVFISFLVRAESGIGSAIEVISNSIREFDLQFPNASAVRDLSGYNRFPIGKKDISGTWHSTSGSFGQYYNVYNGNYAGMNATTISDKFIFSTAGTFQSEFSGATGMAGNQTLFQGSHSGNYAVTDWTVTLTEKAGKKSVYDAYYQAVKGGRILHMQHKQFSGDQYHLSKVN